MSNGPPSQVEWLYRSNWTPTLDSMLLDTLIKMKEVDNWDGTVFPSYYIREADDVIARDLGYGFEWAELLDRLHYLERRYKTFKELVEVYGTGWNRVSNLVTVREGVWSDILPRNPLAGAYHTNGDPAYDKLVTLFGAKDANNKDEKTVILLSDSPESYNNDFVLRNEKTKGKAPMKTPEAKHGPVDHIRRKLLFDNGSPGDRESTTNPGRRYYVLGNAGKMPKQIKGPTNGQEYDTNSNNPIMWWRVPGKPPF